MSRRRIGQETFGFGVDVGRCSSLDGIGQLLDWSAVDRSLAVVSCAAKGEPAWPPLALFKAMLLAVWYDLSDIKLDTRKNPVFWPWISRGGRFGARLSGLAALFTVVLAPEAPIMRAPGGPGRTYPVAFDRSWKISRSKL